MTMHKINRHRTAGRLARRVGVAAVVPIAMFAVVVAACSDDNNNNDKASAEFTGDDCVYSGPTEFEVGDEIEITVSDATEERTDVGFAVHPVPDGTTVAEVREKGIEEVRGQDAEDFPGEFLFSEVTEEGTVRVLTATLDVAGTWLVNCFAMSNHVRLGVNSEGDFPATTFEVVEQS
jgi:hypothetical protein